MKLLEHVTSQEVYDAWLDSLEDEDLHDLTEMGILREYWQESLICLGEDLQYALLGTYPLGTPYDLQKGLQALGVAPMGTEADQELWDDMMRHGYIEPCPVEGEVIAYYRHPMLDPGVPNILCGGHPHSRCA